jgi:hypothetical protein
VKYSITTKCEGCSGTGWTPPRFPDEETDYKHFHCETCGGTGELNFTRSYDRKSHVREDYPEALSIVRCGKRSFSSILVSIFGLGVVRYILKVRDFATWCRRAL